MITAILTVAAIVTTDAFGYWLHRALHQSWMGVLHRAHMMHHLVLYPPTNFSSETYRDAGKDNSTWTFLAIGLPLLCSPLLLALFTDLIGWMSAIWLVLVIGGVGLLHSFIHDWIHLKAHWFHWILGTKRLINLHKIHHVDMGKNYGIFSFWWDKLNKTFEDVK